MLRDSMNLVYLLTTISMGPKAVKDLDFQGKYNKNALLVLFVMLRKSYFKE